MAAFIKRSVDEILAAEPEALIVFQLDSFGGRVDAALDIVETILDIPQGSPSLLWKTGDLCRGLDRSGRQCAGHEAQHPDRRLCPHYPD